MNSNVSSGGGHAQGSKKVVSYFTNWAQYRPGLAKFDTSTIDGNLYTHINFAFAKISKSFEVEAVEWNDVTDPNAGVQKGNYDQITGLKTRFPHLKVLLAFGGWNFNSNAATRDIFGNMASTSVNRAKFIQSAIAWARKYNFDGIDLDWEYPAYAAQGGQPRDTQNFTQLLRDIRTAFDAETASNRGKLLLTIASPAGPLQLAGYELNKIHQYVDWFNLMSYDLHGSWEQTTGFHTALYASDGICVDKAVALYKAAGVPTSKIVMGLATYGRTWTLSNPRNFGPKAPASGPGQVGPSTRETGFLSRYEIQDMLSSGGTEYYDENSKAAYAVKENQWVGYDSPQSMKVKLDYINTNGLGGGMIWAMDLDGPQGAFNELQSIIAQNLLRTHMG